MPGDRHDGGGAGHRQRNHLAVGRVLWLGLLLFIGGCKHPSALSPERVYQEAWFHLERGDLGAALSASDSALQLHPSAGDEWHWRFTLLKAEVVLRQGSNKESLALLAPELPANLAKCDMVVWRKLTQGSAYARLFQFDDGRRAFDEAESFANRGCPELLGEVALRKGTLAHLQGDAPVAEAHYRKSLQIARERKDSYLEVAALGSLGALATKQGHYDESIDWDRAALQLSQSVDAQSSEAKIEGNMGWSYFEMGDFENALALYRQAESAAQRAGVTRDQIKWRTNIGNVYLVQHDYKSAEEAFETALALAKKLGDDESAAECFGNLALVDLETGQLDGARQNNRLLADYAQAHADHFLELYTWLIAGRIDDLEKDYPRAEQSFLRVSRDPGVKISVRWEAESRLAEVYASEGRRADADRQFRSAIATIADAQKAVRREELRLSFLSSAISFYDDYIEFLISQHRVDDALQVAEVSRAQTLAEGLGLASKISFPLPNFQPRRIAERFGATLLFYWLGEKHSYLWTITPSGIALSALPPTSEIEPLIKSYREALLGPRDALETSNPAGIKLYEWLVAPAQKLIPAGSRVIVLPDGALYGLNFETLLAPAPRLHYWIEDAVVANANSLVLLASSANEQAPKSRKLLLIGNPLSPGPEFPDLPQAVTEMDDVERYFPAQDRTVFSRQQATAAAYRSSKPAQYSFIHFVAHGTASRVSPLDSAVILTRQGDSYKLYARDIMAEPLRADLVTISACHGAGERTYSGEGLVGLTWAFLRAGAHGVIAALWEVSDNSTPEMMDDLYAQIKKGSAPDAALRHAKLKLLHSGTVYQKPFYWAPFELYRGH